MSDYSNILFNFIDGGDLNGFSVFDIWKSLGNEGDAQDFLDSMKSPSNIQNLSDLNNDIGFITNAVSDLINYYTKTESYNKEEVNELVSSIPKFNISVVEELPTEGMSATTVYLLKADEEGNNLYTEYIYVNNKWEILGSQKIDLSNYLTKDGDSAENTTTFISNDSTEVTSYTDVNTLTSGEKHSSIFNKISTMFKNIRYLYKMLGTTDISSIGGGTVTGAISNLNTNKVSTTDSRLSDARTPKSHNHNDLYYTETEMDSKLSTINTNVSANASAIATLNSDLTPIHITPLFASISYTNRVYWYYRIGRMYYWNIRFKNTTTLNAGTVLFALPDGVKPLIDQSGTSMSQNGTILFGNNGTLGFGRTSIMKPENDHRYWITSDITVPVNSEITLFGHALVN